MIELIERLKNRLYLLIGRAVLTVVNNSGKYQRLQLKGLNGEVLTDVDRFQPMGLETYPTPDPNTEVIIVCPNGNRENAIAIAVTNREDRPKDLNVGDTRLYDKWGNAVKLEILGITLKTGDAISWKPNVLPFDPFTGLPHGGPGAGIIKLKGS